MRKGALNGNKFDRVSAYPSRFLRSRSPESWRPAQVVAAITILGLASLTGPAAGEEESVEIPVPRLEALPSKIQARLEARERFLMSLPRTREGVTPFELIVEDANLWEPGGVVKVAFFGGSSDLHEQIAEVALKWTDHANLTLDFGHDQATGRFRQWSPRDRDYAADIRIGFERSGHWSVVGTDSANRSIVGPGEASMNFDGFIDRLPARWEGTVLHEFGHALGAHHMHQHPTRGCDDEWRWYDDAGYVRTHRNNNPEEPLTADHKGRLPGLYNYLAGPYNHWTKVQVDFNLRQLANTSAYRHGRFDRESIMLYAFDPWMFKNGADSACFTGRRANVLSPQDRSSIAEYYPERPVAALAESGRLPSRRAALTNILSDPNVSRALESANTSGREFLEAALERAASRQ
ncbi:MAG: hypothetical protein MI755_20205 [Sphingomonadales bacterium]|nr:hypothetical protein [Sphingomonadales bacterium]